MPETQRILLFNEYVRISILFASNQYNTNTLKRNQMLALLFTIQMRSQGMPQPVLPYQLIQTINDIIQGCTYIKFYHIETLISILKELSKPDYRHPAGDDHLYDWRAKKNYLPNDVLFTILFVIDLHFRLQQLKYPNNTEKWHLYDDVLILEIDTILKQSIRFDLPELGTGRQISINGYIARTYILLRRFIYNTLEIIWSYEPDTFQSILQRHGISLSDIIIRRQDRHNPSRDEVLLDRIEMRLRITDETLYNIFRDLLNSLEIPNIEIYLQYFKF
jgi:hypothetical protein